MYQREEKLRLFRLSAIMMFLLIFGAMILRLIIAHYFIGVNLKGLSAYYLSLYSGELLYVLGLVVDGVKHYFNTSFLVATGSSVPYYSVAGLEENNVAYRSFSFNEIVYNQFIVVPDSSFVLSLNIGTALGVRYEFGEEQNYELRGFKLIVKTVKGCEFIPSLPKVKLPIKDELKLTFE